MRKMLLAALVVCIVAFLSMLSMPTVLAAKPKHVSGRLDYCPHPIPPVPAKIAHGNVFLNTWEEGVWSGGIAGVSHDEPCRVVIHGADVFPPTSFDFRWFTGISTLEECTVKGKTGGLVIRLVGKAKFGEIWHGIWVILGGTGELEGIHGIGTWWGPGAPGLNNWGYVDYEGWICYERVIDRSVLMLYRQLHEVQELGF
jgi:hypothetical protein